LEFVTTSFAGEDFRVLVDLEAEELEPEELELDPEELEPEELELDPEELELEPEELEPEELDPEELEPEELEPEELEPDELEPDEEPEELEPEELEPDELEPDELDSTLESTLDTLLTPGLTFIQALRNDRNISAHPLQASTKARMATSLDPVDVPMRSTISSLRGCGTSYPT
jgi:hypothetical protein